jgi:hypothetical protein
VVIAMTAPSDSSSGTAAAPSLARAVAGAVLGAAAAVAGWLSIEYAAGFQLGFIALFVGAFAGFGAVRLARRGGRAVVAVAAVVAAAGLAAGSYGAFRIDKASARDRLRAHAERDPSFAALAPAQQEQELDRVHREQIAPRGYGDFIRDQPTHLLFGVAFTALGLAYGIDLGRRAAARRAAGSQRHRGGGGEARGDRVGDQQ